MHIFVENTYACLRKFLVLLKSTINTYSVIRCHFLLAAASNDTKYKLIFWLWFCHFFGYPWILYSNWHANII